MIVPALLTDCAKELVFMLKECKKFTDYVQIDIMDGKFVSSKSIGPKELKTLKPIISCEAHLMVEDPLDWIEPFKAIGANRIIYQFEIKNDHTKVISKLKENNFSVGIAINPSTAISEFKHLIEDIDTVLFMSVNPGFYGAPFIPEVLDKIKEFKSEFPDKLAGIDGGVKFDNVNMIKATGVDYICVGSAILKAENKKQAYQRFLDLVNE